jgi:nitrogen fixation NifU-like protein
VSTQLRRDLLADHARRLVGRVETPSSGDWREATLQSPTCGDRLTVRVRVASGRLDSVEWHGLGCEVSQASASILAELASGMPVVDVPAMVARVDAVVGGADRAEDDPAAEEPAAADPALGDIVALAGIGRLPLRGRCALLAWRALSAAVEPAAGETRASSR